MVLDEKGKFDKYRIEYKAPMPIEAEYAEDKKLKIKSSSSFSFDNTDKINVTEKNNSYNYE